MTAGFAYVKIINERDFFFDNLFCVFFREVNGFGDIIRRPFVIGRIRKEMAPFRVVDALVIREEVLDTVGNGEELLRADFNWRIFVANAIGQLV